MKKYFLILSIVFALLFVLAACANPAGTTPPASESTAASQDVSAVSADTAAVSIKDFAFNPETLTVKAGTTVIWTNNDSAAHDIKIADITSPMMATGETFEYKFDSPGTYEYSCGVHPSMKGTVIVQ